MTTKKITREIEFTKGDYIAGTKNKFLVFEATGVDQKGKKYTGTWIEKNGEVEIDYIRDEEYEPTENELLSKII